jgi:hypothetical protein
MTDPDDSPDHENNDRATIAAIVFVVALIALSIWLFNKLSDANSALNCVASGRTNCASTNASPPQ